MGGVWSLGGNSSHGATTPDVLIARLAARQHGVVSQAQLLAAGLDRDAIAYRRRVGRLHLLHRGVYAVGHRPPSPLATAIAAVLACGPDAALSHRSAAARWRIVLRWPARTHMTAPTSAAAPDPDPPLPPRRHDHPLRDPRHHSPPDPGRPRRRPDPKTPHPSPQRNPGPTAHHPNRADRPPHPLPAPPARPRRPLRPLPQTPPPPTPRTNTRSAGHEVDAVYRQHKLIIELDSRQLHTTPTPFEQDRDRDADLLNAGFSTLRITNHRLKHHATNEAKRLRSILQSRS